MGRFARAVNEEWLMTEGIGAAAEWRGPAGLTFAEWGLLLVLAAVQITHIVDFMILMPLGPRLMHGLHISPGQFGLMVSAYGFSASLAGLAAAWCIDRFDRKTALLLLYAGFTLGTLLCALATSYPLLLAARTVAGAFGGVSASCVLAIVGDAFPDSRRGTAMGVIMSAFSLASIAGVPAGIYLANALDSWQAPFAVLAGLSAAVLVGAWFLLPRLRGHLDAVHHLQRASTWAVLSHPNHVRAYVLMVSLVLSTFCIAPYLATYLVANVGRAESELAYVYLCGGAATLFTTTPVGWLSDRLGKRPVFRFFALFTVVPILLTTNLPRVPLVVALAVTTLFMITSSARMVPAMALITGCAVPRYRGSFLSVNSSVQQMAMGLASLIGGGLLSTGAGGELIGFPWVGAVSVAGTLLSVYLIGHLRRPGPEALAAVDPVEGPRPAGLPLPQSAHVAARDGVRTGH
jgi:predicted MFS family arabinose efflux permease